jgi:hypothetical protein
MFRGFHGRMRQWACAWFKSLSAAASDWRRSLLSAALARAAPGPGSARGSGAPLAVAFKFKLARPGSGLPLAVVEPVATPWAGSERRDCGRGRGLQVAAMSMARKSKPLPDPAWGQLAAAAAVPW